MTLAVLAGAHSAMQMTGFAFPSTRANKGLHNAVIYAGSMGAAGGIASIISTTAGDFPLSSLRTIALSHVAFLGIEYILHTKKCVPKWLVEFTSDWVRKFLLTEAKDVLLLEVISQLYDSICVEHSGVHNWSPERAAYNRWANVIF
eukprot:GHVT01044003.1.p2 GENE.GHVT01044003.1~~GHVT01044003.1.p2  ORF type:complete len:146 (-),score=5.52 GHVT01044003.1:2740-3177(-)